VKQLDNIIKQCIAGDQRACKSLYNEYLAYIYGLAKRYGIKENDRKDILQIVFSEIFKSLSCYDKSKAAFKTWITRIAVNKMIEFRKKHRYANTIVEINEAQILQQIGSVAPTGGKLEKEYILSVLNQMPIKHQAVFNMFILDGYSHKEIADTLKISEGQSRITLNRARQWAKKALEEYLKYH